MREAMSWVEKIVCVVRSLNFGGFLVESRRRKEFSSLLEVKLSCCAILGQLRQRRL